MRRKIASICLSLTMLFAGALPTFAGGALEQIDITGNVPSPIAGHLVARVIPIKWDARTIPVNYKVNTNTGSLVPGTVPNPLGAPFLTVAAAQTALQDSFNAWNNIPTSFIQMQITGTISKTTLAGFDFVNELTFRTSNAFGAIASSPSTSLISDVTLEDGDQIDNDLDSDVSSAITVAADVDGDGDIEFPAGFYKAGTILDNDVQFNTKTSNGLRFTVDPAARDTTTRSVDLKTVAVHEFGHSHGLSHSLDNQTSATDGDGATMFPFIDTGDPAAESAQASLGTDDIAYSSFYYQEGSASSGPGALQSGDVDFNKAFGLITGELRHGILNQPIAGGSVYAINRDTNSVIGSGFSGTTRVSFNPANGGLFIINPAFNIPDGKYVIPVTKGNYAVGVEATDGNPAAAGNISLTCQIGGIFGQLNFNEEFYNRNNEGVVELRPGQNKNVHVNPGRTEAGIDITTGRTFNINNFGNRNFIGFTNQAAGSYYAVRIPASQIQTVINQVNAVNPGKDVRIQAIAYDNAVVDASVAPVFAEATLTTGTVNPDGSVATVDLVNPLQRVTGLLGADDDFAPFFFQEPQELGRVVRDGIASGAIQNLFLVLRLPTTTPFAGVSNRPPLIGLDGSGTATGLPNDAPMFALSYVSTTGVTFNRVNNFNFRFSLILSEPAN